MDDLWKIVPAALARQRFQEIERMIAHANTGGRPVANNSARAWAIELREYARRAEACAAILEETA